MNRIKLWAARTFFGDFLTGEDTPSQVRDASGSRQLVTGLVKKIGLRMGDTTNTTEFEPPDFDLTAVYNGYNTDSYIRQGIDKYVDQIFKEGFDFFGKDTNVVDYLRLRLEYMAEATGVPTSQLLIDIAEDVVKYGNAIIAKARAKDASVLPPSSKVTGLNGSNPVAGYFCLNVTSMSVQRDKNGTVKRWQQEVSGSDATVGFKSEDIVHIYYKREKGAAFGTGFLIPVLDDVRALRQAEENVLRMMYRNIYPFYHMAVGDKDAPGTPAEIAELQGVADNMEVEGGIVTSSRVTIKPIATDQVINAEPYLNYLEERVFSGMGIPAIMFGRGNTANRSTGDNMASEMSDRIKAMQRTIEMFINHFIVKEILMEGGFDPILNLEHKVEFKFRENDLDAKIKAETHAIYKFEHNATSEDEMRGELGQDPITDRAKMHQMLITQANATHLASVGSGGSSSSEAASGTKETDNKQKPSNQHGTKTSPKKVTNSEQITVGLLRDAMDDMSDRVKAYLQDCSAKQTVIEKDKIDSYAHGALQDILTVIQVNLDAESYDVAALSSRSQAILDRFRSDVHDSFISLADYTEATNLIGAILDLTESELVETIEKGEVRV